MNFLVVIFSIMILNFVHYSAKEQVTFKDFYFISEGLDGFIVYNSEDHFATIDFEICFKNDFNSDSM